MMYRQQPFNQYFIRVFVILCLFLHFSCNDKGSEQVVDNQGIFEFPEVMRISSASDIPKYLNPEKILCKGKGLKVARCISGQLKTGKCLGIIKEGSQVYVVEIDCNEVKEESESELDLGDQ